MKNMNWCNPHVEKFSGYFGKWMMNQQSTLVTLDVKYNQSISLMEEKEIYDGYN